MRGCAGFAAKGLILVSRPCIDGFGVLAPAVEFELGRRSGERVGLTIISGGRGEKMEKLRKPEGHRKGCDRMARVEAEAGG